MIDCCFDPYRCNIFERYVYGRLKVCTADLIRASLEHDSCDPSDFYNEPDSFPFSPFYFVRQQRSLEELLRSQPLPLSSIPLQSRLRAAVDTVSHTSTPDRFLKLCGLKSVTHELATTRSTKGRTALTGAIKAMQYRLGWGRSVQGWPDFAQSLLERGAELHQANNRHLDTMMLCMLRASFSDDQLEAALKRLRLWIDIIAAAGRNLLEYGQQESMQWRRIRDDSARLYKRFHLSGRYYLLDFKYGPNAEDWSLMVQARSKLYLFERQPIPGGWEDDRIPRLIAWAPQYDDIDSEMWRVIDRAILCGEPQDIRQIVEEQAPSAVEQSVASTQDDHGIMALMVLRSRSASGSRQRSASQPPSLRRRQRQYHFAQRLAHHKTWRVDYHLCPADGLHRFGCRTHRDVPGLTYSEPKFSLAHCVKAGCSRGVDDFESGNAHPFSPWDLKG